MASWNPFRLPPPVPLEPGWVAYERRHQASRPAFIVVFSPPPHTEIQLWWDGVSEQDVEASFYAYLTHPEMDKHDNPDDPDADLPPGYRRIYAMIEGIPNEIIFNAQFIANAGFSVRKVVGR